MYTGIVQELGQILTIHKCDFGNRISIQCSHKFILDIIIGASVSINGTCVTVVEFNTTTALDKKLSSEHTCFTVEVSQATLDITNLNELEINSLVNMERSAKIGDENGGHQIAGHVIGKGKVKELREVPQGLLRVEIPQQIIKYIFDKGFIALNGMSVTVADIDIEKSIVSINLIPQTLKMTNILTYKANDYLNIEIDQMTKTIVDTINSINYLKER